MKRDRLIKDAESRLDSDGFATVLASNMHTCADIFAERKGKKFIIKIVSNIDSVARKEANTLYKLARFLDAEPIILGLIPKSAKLGGNVVHYRFSIRCISPEMLTSMASNGPELLASKSVGVKVRIDAYRLRNLMKINNLKVAALANEAKLSKATLYKHERAGGYAAIGTVSRLERILNGSIRAETASEMRSVALHSSRLAKTDIAVMQLDRAPFDMVAKSRNYYEISLNANIRTLMKRAALFRSIRETFENNYPFFINEKRSGRMEGIPVVKKKDLVKLGSEEELLNLVY